MLLITFFVELRLFGRGLEKNGMVRAWHGRGMASVNQTRPYCVNQMGKTHSKPLAARHGRGKAWARHAMCKSVFMWQWKRIVYSGVAEYFLEKDKDNLRADLTQITVL
jgi:hypothetical protein